MNTQDNDKLYYDSQKVDNLSFFSRKIKSYFDKYRHIIEDKYKNHQEITVLEMGAGSCTLSLLMSSFEFVKRVVCYDISAERMKSMVSQNALYVPSNLPKLEFVEGDFSEKIPFESNSIDIILFDASLHHTRSMWNTIAECRRVLKTDGMIIAQRESSIGMFTYKIKLKNLLDTEEVKMGVSENVYLKEQYDYYFKANGFSTLFIPMAENLVQRMLIPLNGFIFSKWIIVAEVEK